MKEFKYFILTDYEKEEAYLRNKHLQGYELISVSIPGIYTFKKCEPKDVVYRLDFNPLTKEDKQSYIQMFEDYGWEYIQDMNEYSYFRKEASRTNEQENEIFGDDESRLEMLRRIIRKRMLPILVVFLCCFLPNIHTIINSISFDNVLSIFIGVLFIIILLFYIYLLIRLLIGFKQLSQKYKTGK